MSSAWESRIIQAAADVVDAWGEYTSDTHNWVREAEAVPGLKVSIDDDLGDARIIVELHNVVVFRVIARNPREYEIFVFEDGPWVNDLLGEGSKAKPRNRFTFGESSIDLGDDNAPE